MRPPLGSPSSVVVPFRLPEGGGPRALRPAGFWPRAAAAAIDALVVVVGGGILLFPIDAAIAAGGLPAAVAAALTAATIVGRLALAWLYLAGTESSERQATLGKIALGLAVADGAGARLTFRRATERLLSKLLSLLPLGLGFGLAAVTRRKTALHDLVAGTRVVHRGPASGVGIGAAAAVAAVLLAFAIPNVLEVRARVLPAAEAAPAACAQP